MTSLLGCPGCRGKLEAVEVDVAGAGPVVDQRVTLRYLCHGCGAHVTRRKVPHLEETIEYLVPTDAATLPHETREVTRPAAESPGGRVGAVPPTGLVCLTYMSTATDPFDEDALHTLLSQSRSNNHARGLTGMLLYAGGHFIQTLEGPGEAVDATYGHISSDGRHRDLVVTLRDDIDERRFGDWSMGFDTLHEDEVTDVVGFNNFMSAGSPDQQTAQLLGRAGVFHRLFRDRMR